ncbi:MAG: cbb3-type cytochrome c oxidase subunit I, partial [Rugosibacter sp.]|nr:cbb3-type cytochrome c oxidase subunit I [Rugosibacter sp.]
MTAVAPKPVDDLDHPPGVPTGTARPGSFVWKMMTTTDHKLLGLMYIVTCFVFFFIGGLMALLIRAELFVPGMQFLSNEQFNQLFTMHGTVMLLLYGTPIVIGFANYIMPLQI